MRRNSPLVMLFFIALGTMRAQELTLIVPNGGEILTCGTAMSIAWSSDGMSGSEAVLLSLEGASDFGPIARSTAGAGSLEWPAGRKMDGTFAKPGTGYRVSIRQVENEAVFDQSDESFTLAAPAAAVSLLAPNGGETLSMGSDIDIDWACAGQGGTVNLLLLKDDLPLGAIAESLPAGRLRCRWRLGAPLLNGAAYGAGDGYRVRIQLSSAKPPRTAPGPGLGENAPGRTAEFLPENSDDSDDPFSMIDP